MEETGRACDASVTLQRGVLMVPVSGCRCASGPGACVAVVQSFCLGWVSFCFPDLFFLINVSEGSGIPYVVPVAVCDADACSCVSRFTTISLP